MKHYGGTFNVWTEDGHDLGHLLGSILERDDAFYGALYVPSEIEDLASGDLLISIVDLSDLDDTALMFPAQLRVHQIATSWVGGLGGLVLFES